LGTPRVVIEVARNVPVWTWDLKSEAFGNSVPAQDPDGDANPLMFDMRFPGQRYDVASGLNYNYFRNYDAGIGRYAASDPIGLLGGMSTFAYVGNSPLVYSDPLGLIKWTGKEYTVGAMIGIGGSVTLYNLESECVNGIKAKVRVVGVGPSLGVEAKTKIPLPPIAGTGSDIEVEDVLNYIDPYFAFDGAYGQLSGGASLIAGYNCSIHVLGFGLAQSRKGAQGGGCGMQFGLAGAGLGLTIGSSRVVGTPKYVKCDSCE
jgi:RHS repeat-associated protein